MTRKKILLVDDVNLSIEMEKATLLRTNCDIITASNGREALDLAETERPDLIVMDLYMPEMNGDDACRRIKSDPSLREIPVIMTTTAGSPGDEDKCLAAECDGFITKPFKGLDLLRMVEGLIEVIVREHIRLPIDVKVSYSFDDNEYEGYAHDVSEGGMFIEGKTEMPVGARLDIRFRLPETRVLVEAEGEVARVVAKSSDFRADIVPGMGIRFLRLSVDGERAIVNYTHKIS